MEFKIFLLYLAVCFSLSFFIGIERQFRRRIIGLRTTILVSVGAFLYVSMSFSVSNADLTRIAAQVVSGIGFLGAGVIIKDGLKIRGLTTAATLWCDAAIGVLCACGAILEAVAGTLVILFANVILRYVNVLINAKIDENNIDEIYELRTVISKQNAFKIKDTVYEFIHQNDKVELKGFDLNEKGNEVDLLFKMSVPKIMNRNLQKLVDGIYENYEIKKIECNKTMEIHNEEEEEAL